MNNPVCVALLASTSLVACASATPSIPTRPQAQTSVADLALRLQSLKDPLLQQAGYEQNPAVASYAIATDPANVNARIGLSQREMLQHDWPDAVTQLKEVVRLAPADRSQAFLLGICLERERDKAAAVAQWKALAGKKDSWGQSALRHLRYLQSLPPRP